MLQVLPAISLHFSAAGALQIHDAMDAGVHRRYIDGAARFDQHAEFVVTERFHQRQRVGLQQRFAAGQFDQGQAAEWGDGRCRGIRFRNLDFEGRGQAANLREHSAQGPFLPLRERVSRVTIGAAQIAGS